MKSSCAIFTNDNQEILPQLYEYFKVKNDDVFFITENPDLRLSNNYAVMYSFYLKFYSGSVVFTNIENYIYNKEHLSAQKVYVLTNMEEILSNNLDKSCIKNINIIFVENGEIKES